jgi:membrane dipeptidase
LNPADLHQKALVFDSHADTVLRIVDKGHELNRRNREHHIDIPRLREGGIDIQGFAIWVNPNKYAEAPAENAFYLLEALEKELEKNAEDLTLVRTAAEAEKAAASGKIGMLLALEGGHALEDKPEMLETLKSRGISYVTLTWMNTNNWADSSNGERKWGGLNDLGEKMVNDMNRLGLMIDLSHSSDETVRRVLQISEHPVLMTHSCCRALCDIKRNVSDELLEGIAGNGGVVGVNYFLGFLSQTFSDSLDKNKRLYDTARLALEEKSGLDSPDYNRELLVLEQEHKKRRGELPGVETDYRVIVDHIDHIVKVAGIDHVGLGSDFDGVFQLPQGMKDTSDVPKITEELVNRGYNEVEIHKILGNNYMRVFRKVCG